jgi:hypothetical protein
VKQRGVRSKSIIFLSICWWLTTETLYRVIEESRNPFLTHTVHQTRYCRFVWHRKIGKCIPKLILESWVRTRCQVVFDNEHSLHLRIGHPCTSTVERQLTDWRGQVTTWRDLRGLLYSHSDIVCLLIQSNCTELQSSINILMWVAWLSDHSVFGHIENYMVIGHKRTNYT